MAPLELGVTRGAALEPTPPPPGKPIVVCGTSIAQGACATTDGSHPNDLGMTRQASAVVEALRTLLG